MKDIIERLESFDKTAKRILDNHGCALTVGGQATAIAMLVTINLELFSECIAALKAREQLG